MHFLHKKESLAVETGILMLVSLDVRGIIMASYVYQTSGSAILKSSFYKISESFRINQHICETAVGSSARTMYR